MRIVIPVDEQSLESNVSKNFARAANFLIFDTESKEANFFDNAAAASSGGAGIKAAQFVIDQKATVALAPRLGGNAEEVLKGADIKLYKTEPGTAQANLDSFLDGKLDSLTETHGGFHHGG
ncbi:MAG: NifB/NifX family molybdenum-iron cluster-binding protein [Bacillota bacterium]